MIPCALELAVKLDWFSADIAGVGCNIFVWSRIEGIN